MPLTWAERQAIGHAIRQARHAKGVRQRDLAEKVGARAEFVGWVERGYRAYTNDERNEKLIKAMVDVLGLTLDGLL